LGLVTGLAAGSFFSACCINADRLTGSLISAVSEAHHFPA
jgi:hypothetical protein